MGYVTTTLLAGAAIAGTGLQAYGQYKAAQDQAKAEEYNAAVARQEAAIIAEQGKLDVYRQRKQSKSFLSQQQVLIAKSGIAFSGSAFEVYKDSAEELELDALLIEYNSSIEERRAISEAEQRESLAKRIRRGGVIDAASTVLKQSASFLASKGLSGDMGGGGISPRGNVYGSNTPAGVRDMGTYSRLPGRR